jgi:hypothetical protein
MIGCAGHCAAIMAGPGKDPGAGLIASHSDVQGG